MANPLRVNAAELLRRPGTEKLLDLDVTVADLGVDDERFRPSDPVHIQLRLESLTDAIMVSGEVVATWHTTCRRCAMPAEGELRCEVDERYQETVTDPDAFPLEGAQLDLEPMAREVLVLDAPIAAVCRDDCAGLCPECGTDLNTGSCSCRPAVSDPRWAALDQLKNTFDPGDDA